MLKKSNQKTQKTSLQGTQKHWVFKLTIDQVSLIFEANDLSCFGRKAKQKHLEFIKEYNEMFNSGSDNKQFDNAKFLLKLYTKHLKLRVMYHSLTTCAGENSAKEFKEIFGHEFKSIDDLKLLTDEAQRINDKMTILNAPKKDDKGVSFSKLINIVETSRGIPIDRNIKLFQFKEMYDTELEKWNKAA